MKTRTSSTDPLSALSLPKDDKVQRYPWPLITCPIEKDAIAKLRELRKEWQKENPFTFNVLRKRLERRGGRQRKYPLDLEAALALHLPKQSRGRRVGYSPLETQQSWAVYVLITYCGIKPVEILSALNKDISSDNPASFRWLARRRAQGKKILGTLSQQETKVFEQKLASFPPHKLREALLDIVRENPA